MSDKNGKKKEADMDEVSRNEVWRERISKELTSQKHFHPFSVHLRTSEWAVGPEVEQGQFE